MIICNYNFVQCLLKLISNPKGCDTSWPAVEAQKIVLSGF